METVIEWFHALLSQLTYSVTLENPGSLAALFSLGIMSDIGVPLPFVLETFLFFASYRVGPLSSHVLLTLMMILCGREAGAAILYSLSALMGSPLTGWFEKRFSWLHRDLQWFRARLNKQTVIAVATIRLTPGLLQVPSLFAGFLRLPYWHFAAGVAISSLAYDVALISFGFLARIALSSVSTQLRTYLIVGAIALAIIAWIILFITFRRSSRFGKSGSQQDSSL